MGNKFSGYLCWDLDRVGDVINKQALSVDRATFLATHVEMDQIIVEKTPHILDNTTEDGLLNELDKLADENNHTFMVIKGIPGTGKSHLIRWLKERYDSKQPDDVTLLIERFDSSLKSTLSQIIDSGIFSEVNLPDQLNRLREATNQLTSDELAENIIDQLRIGHKQVIDGRLDIEKLPPRLERNVENFLLDISIRKKLKEENGPIDRIKEFLKDGRETRYSVKQAPGFELEDFNFSHKEMNEIRGYKEARSLAEDLGYKSSHRVEFARYLNQILAKYAISHATLLSSTDLKESFGEVREKLREQGRSLALFIEDITSFTGLDRGIIDVLITPHTGEVGEKYCRLTSIIGITDGYYTDQFPDNVKERISHLVLLNSETSRNESTLLKNPNKLAAFAGRYLNAIRVSSEELEKWSKEGAPLTEIPNKCDSCPHRDTCHQAFGTVKFENNGVTQEIGLYPYNNQALVTMYDQIDLSIESKTPRTFINGILSFVLQSHGQKIESGKFPPRANQLGNDFTAPAFDDPVYRQFIDLNSPNKAEHIKSLLLFWGDRTIDQKSRDGINYIGGINEKVFTAFQLPVLQQKTEERDSKKIPESTSKQTEDPSSDDTSKKDEYLRDIDGWLDGEALQYYEIYTRWLINFIKEFIDWDLYEVPLSQVDKIMNPGRFSIEGQSGRVRGKPYIFHRCREFSYILIALIELNSNDRWADVGDSLPTHLVNLSSWVRKNENNIIDYVRYPSKKVEVNEVCNLLFIDCVLLAILEGQIKAPSSELEFYNQIIDYCVNRVEKSEHIDSAKKYRSDKWFDLLNKIKNTDIDKCNQELLVSINCRQGDSRNIIFLDPTKIITPIRNLEKKGLLLEDFPLLTQNQGTGWEYGGRVYSQLEEQFESVVLSEWNMLLKYENRIVNLMGENSLSAIHKKIKNLILKFRENQISYNRKFDSIFSLEPAEINKAEKNLEKLSKIIDNLSNKSLFNKSILLSRDIIELFQGAKYWFDNLPIFEERIIEIQANLDGKLSESNKLNNYQETKKQTEQKFNEVLDVYRQIRTEL